MIVSISPSMLVLDNVPSVSVNTTEGTGTDVVDIYMFGLWTNHQWPLCVHWRWLGVSTLPYHIVTLWRLIYSNTPPYHEPTVYFSSLRMSRGNQETPSICRSWVNRGLGSAFVNMSATLSLVWMYLTTMSPICACLRMKWYFISKCFTRVWAVGSLESEIAALLSQKMEVSFRVKSQPSSFVSIHSQIHSWVDL